MTTINNIAEIITEQLKFAKNNGETINNELINSYYSEIINADIPKGSEIFTRKDIVEYHINKIVLSVNFQFLLTDKGVILINKFF